MDVKVPFECPGCRHEGRARLELLGQATRCKHCGSKFRMPRHLRVPCRSCGHVVRVPPESVDHGVVCRRCERPFRVRLTEAVPVRLDASSLLRPPARLAAPAPVPPADPILAGLEAADPPPEPGELRRLAAEADSLRDSLDEAREEREALLARVEAMAAAERELRAELQAARKFRDELEPRLAAQAASLEQYHAELLRITAEADAESSRFAAALSAVTAERDHFRLAHQDLLNSPPSPDPAALALRAGMAPSETSRLAEEAARLRADLDVSRHRALAAEATVSQLSQDLSDLERKLQDTSSQLSTAQEQARLEASAAQRARDLAASLAADRDRLSAELDHLRDDHDQRLALVEAARYQLADRLAGAHPTEPEPEPESESDDPASPVDLLIGQGNSDGFREFLRRHPH